MVNYYTFPLSQPTKAVELRPAPDESDTAL